MTAFYPRTETTYYRITTSGPLDLKFFRKTNEYDNLSKDNNHFFAPFYEFASGKFYPISICDRSNLFMFPCISINLKNNLWHSYSLYTFLHIVLVLILTNRFLESFGALVLRSAFELG